MKAIDKVEEILNDILDDYYELNEESFSFYSDRLYKMSSELHYFRKMISLEYKVIKLKDDEQFLYTIEETKLKKYEKLNRRAKTGELIIIDSDNCLLGKDSKGRIFEVENDDDSAMQEYVQRHVSLGMCAIYDTQYK